MTSSVFQIANEMCSTGPLQPMKSAPLQVLTHVMEHARTTEDKKKKIVSVLTQGWLEKILEHVAMVLETTKQDTTQAAMILKDLLMNVASALETDGTANVPNVTSLSEQASDKQMEEGPHDEESSDDDSSSSSDSDSESDSGDDRARPAPPPLMRYPVVANAYGPAEPVTYTPKLTNANEVTGEGTSTYPIQVKRFKEGKYTLLLKGYGPLLKKSVAGSVLGGMVKNSTHPSQKWKFDNYQKSDWLVTFDNAEHAKCFANQSITVKGQKLKLEPFNSQRAQVLTCNDIAKGVDLDRMLITLTKARPANGTYVAMGQVAKKKGNKKKGTRKEKKKKSNSRKIVVVFDGLARFESFELLLGQGPKGGSRLLHFAAKTDPKCCKACHKTHAALNCPQLQPLKLSSGRPLKGLLQKMPNVSARWRCVI